MKDLCTLLAVSTALFAQSDKVARGKYLVEEVERGGAEHPTHRASQRLAQDVARPDQRRPSVAALGREGPGRLLQNRQRTERQSGRPAHACLQDVGGRRRSRRGISEVLEVKPAVLLFAATPALLAQTAANTLVVVNDSSLFSRRIADYYVHKRSIPLANVCHLKAPIEESIPRDVYEKGIEAPIAAYLTAHGLREQI